MVDAITLNNISITRLSDITPATWSQSTNQWDEPPTLDYAFSSPFQLFTPSFASLLKTLCSNEYNGVHEYSTKRTQCCLRGARSLQEAVASCRTDLERIASTLVGTRMLLHGMRHEWAHVNVQRSAERAVDDWHQDSMPFVLVSVLTNHEQDQGGSLIVRRSGGSEFKCKLRRPGESILMQGSHIWHKAEPSMTGERLTLVTSFVVESLEVYDTSSIRLAVQYTPPHECIHQFLNHALKRIYYNNQSAVEEEEDDEQRRGLENYSDKQQEQNMGRALVREKEIKKIIDAFDEIQLLVGYNRKTCRDHRMVVAFDRWLGVITGALLRNTKENENIKKRKSKL